MKLKKRGNILTENIIFIVLNLLFLIILFVFLFSKTGAVAVIEEKYAKQIALMIDAAEPPMSISIEVSDAIEAAQDENFPPDKLITINGNIVTVKLSEDSKGYSYSFFNDVEANANFKDKNSYYITINKK